MDYLKVNQIITRPIWQLNHLQKSYKNCQNYRIENAPDLLKLTLSLPSSVRLSNKDINFVINHIIKCMK